MTTITRYILLLSLATMAICPAWAQVAAPSTAPASMPAAKFAFFGVSTAALEEHQAAALKLPGTTGLLVLYVEPNSPAQQAGIRANDVLLKYDDQLLVNAPQLSTLVRISKPAQQVAITFSRDGKSDVAKVQLGEREVSDQPRATIRMANAAQAQQIATSKARMADKDHDLTLMIDGQDKRLTVSSVAGKRQLFDGPVNTPQERAALPQGVLPKLEQLEQAVQRSRALTLAQLQASTTPARSVQVKIDDGQYNLTLQADAAGKRLKAVDAKGTVLFEGPIDTEAQRKNIPTQLLPLVSALELKLAASRTPATAPAK